jgi:hypothetical protein
MTAGRWFAAKCIFAHPDSPKSARRTVYEERIVLLRAGDADDAIRRAEVEAAHYAAETSVTFIDEFVTTFELFDKPREMAEVYSLMRTSALSPRAFIDRYHDDGTEHARRSTEGGRLSERKRRAPRRPKR